MEKVSPSGRVVVVGAGMVGSTAAYTMVAQETAKSVLLIDIAEDLAKANVLDMHDAANFTNGVEVLYATYSDLIDGDIIVVTAGAAQKDGQTRLDLLTINAKIIRDIVSKIKETKKKVFILMITNPVDVLTYIAATESDLPNGMVFGSGTFLDTARLRGLIHEDLNVNPINVHAYILGEHGDSSFPALSSANIGGVKLSEIITLDEAYRESVKSRVRDMAYKIIEGKKATYFGIGSAVSRICRAIIRDEHRIMPLSVVLNGEYGLNGVAIGVPAKLSSAGVEIYKEVPLDTQEKEYLEDSARVIKNSIDQVSSKPSAILFSKL